MKSVPNTLARYMKAPDGVGVVTCNWRRRAGGELGGLKSKGRMLKHPPFLALD